jgi:competence protein ComEA
VDPSPTPWRVLEDPVGPAAAAADDPGPRRSGILAIPKTTVLAGGAAALLAITAFALALGSGSSGSVAVVGSAPFGSGSPRASSGAASDPVDGDRVVVVEIVGAVSHPGVFRMPDGARVGDLLSAAGGYGPRVDAGRAARDLNLAAPLHDGDQIRVPSRDDTAVAGSAPPAGGGIGSAGGGGATAGPIDLNRATAAELDVLPGIGPATAAKIIASRDGQPFAAIEDLRTRKLVGEKTFANLKDLVTVR